MYFLCTVHPELEETKEKGYMGIWMTLDQKKKFIHEFYNYKSFQEIPFSLEHKAQQYYGSVIKRQDRDGKVLDLFIDKRGDIIAKGILYKDTESYKNIEDYTFNDDDTKKGKPWGVSMRLDCLFPFDDNKDVIKKITHIALTQEPFFAKKGTYIHHWSNDEDAINRTISKYYYKENMGSCYITDILKNKINMSYSMLFHSFYLIIISK